MLPSSCHSGSTWFHSGAARACTWWPMTESHCVEYSRSRSGWSAWICLRTSSYACLISLYDGFASGMRYGCGRPGTMKAATSPGLLLLLVSALGTTDDTDGTDAASFGPFG